VPSTHVASAQGSVVLVTVAAGVDVVEVLVATLGDVVELVDEVGEVVDVLDVVDVEVLDALDVDVVDGCEDVVTLVVGDDDVVEVEGFVVLVLVDDVVDDVEVEEVVLELLVEVEELDVVLELVEVVLLVVVCVEGDTTAMVQPIAVPAGTAFASMSNSVRTPIGICSWVAPTATTSNVTFATLTSPVGPAGAVVNAATTTSPLANALGFVAGSLENCAASPPPTSVTTARDGS
jgi:hypothetical protein